MSVWTVLLVFDPSDTYVTSESGTGVVHQAPGFGEDDFRVCLSHGIINKVCGVWACGYR